MAERWEQRIRDVRVEIPPDMWRRVEAGAQNRAPVGPPPRRQRLVAAAIALAVFACAGAFAWSAFRPSSEPATVGSADSTALVATLQAPEDGTIPGLKLAYGDTSRDYFAEGGHWPGVSGFNLPGFGFNASLPAGTSLTIEGDASQVQGKLEVLDGNVQSTGEFLPIDLSAGSATLPTDPGLYRLHLTGTWPQGTAEFFVVIHIEAPSATPTSDGESSTDVYFDDVRLSVAVPTGWTVADHNLTPWLSKPTEIMSVGTFDMPVSHDPGDPLRVSDAPVAPAALAAMTGTDAFISVQAAGPTDQPDDRPPSFRDMPARSCCSAQTGDYPFKWWWIPFIDGGRAYYLFVAVGNDANVATQDQAWTIADSLTFSGGSAPSSSEVP